MEEVSRKDNFLLDAETVDRNLLFINCRTLLLNTTASCVKAELWIRSMKLSVLQSHLCNPTFLKETSFLGA